MRAKWSFGPRPQAESDLTHHSPMQAVHLRNREIFAFLHQYRVIFASMPLNFPDKPLLIQ
jgi:hypothetical protein